MNSEVKWYTRNDVTDIALMSGRGLYKGVFSGTFGEVVIKTFDISDERRKREIASLISFTKTNKHDNIIKIFGAFNLNDSGLTTNRYGYVMEFMAGGSLKSIISSRDAYSPDNICSWMAMAATGDKFLCENTISYRNICPSNMLLNADKSILKLADFGICKRFNGTMNTGNDGFYSYIAPEVLSGEGDVNNHVADIYSLGITIWELFHRKQPYMEETTLALYEKVMSGERPAINAEMPEGTTQLIKRCWSRDSGNRPQIEEIIDFFNKKLERQFPLKKLDDFTSVTELGSGSIGTTCLGDLEEESEVVIKRFTSPNPELSKEVEIMFKCSKHPNLVEVYGILWDGLDKRKYLGYTREYVKMSSLHNAIYNHEDCYNELDIWTWIKQIALGLEHLHNEGIMHNCVKPKNILLATKNHLKLADFGITRSIGSTPEQLSYMAPEVVDTKEYSFPADIYSLAITIWEIVHRKVPYAEMYVSNSQMGTEEFKRIKEITRPPIDSNKLDEDLSKFIQRCWQKNACDRPSIKEITEYFRETTFNSSTSAEPEAISKTKLDISFYELNDFTNLTIIGNGSSGRIYKGELEDFGPIVVKEFFWSSQQPLEKYKREVEILVKHNHPNIVQLYGILWNGSDPSRYLGYVMEYVEGGSLHKVIYDRTKNYDTAQICRWVKQIARGLQFLHKNQIIHRDIKPANILVGSQLKLADFGIARDVDVSHTAGVGTYRYMAPEVITTGKYGPAADIYSLAITIWELFHRKKPYTELGGNELVIIVQVMKEGARPVFNSEQIDENTARFIQRCWHTSATDRPSLKEVIDHFGSKADSSVVPVDPAPSFDPLGPVNVRGRPMLSCDSNLTILVLGGGKYIRGSDKMVILIRDKWIKLPLKLPKRLDAGGAVYLDGEIYIFGGISMKKELYKLDNETLKWIQLADMNESRWGITNSSVEWNGSIWVFGGGNLKSVERYDPKKNKWIKMPDMKYSRRYVAAAVHNGKFIVCGGVGDGWNRLKSVECFDPESGVWTEMNDMPTPRAGHSLVSYGNNLILMGGHDGNTEVNTVLELNNLEQKGTWKELPPMEQPRISFSAAVLDNEIFVIGGWDGIGKSLDKTEIFNGKNWRQGSQLPNWCSSMSSIVIPRHLADILSNSTE